MPSIVSNTPGCEDCCDEETCLFNVSLRFYKCYYDYDGAPFPDGPLTFFNGLAGLWEEITGTMTYNGVTYQISIPNFQGTQIPTQSFNNISKIDETSEVVINIDPLSTVIPFPGTPENCYGGETVSYDEIRFIPQCGQNTKEMIGKVIMRKFAGVAIGCGDSRQQYFSPEQLVGVLLGLEGASITISTDVDTKTSSPYERLSVLYDCQPQSQYYAYEYKAEWMELEGFVPPGTRDISVTFNPPPGIPGYKSTTMNSQDLLVKTPSGPLDTCGYVESLLRLPVIFNTERNVKWGILKDDYSCHCRGWPIKDRLNYSDGIFSGTINRISDNGIIVGYRGILSGNCPGARNPIPQGIGVCCSLGGITYALITVGVCGITSNATIPPDVTNKYSVAVTKSVGMCVGGECGSGVLIFHTLSNNSNPNSWQASGYGQGTAWKDIESNYTPLDIHVPLVKQANMECLEGIAHITEPP